LQRAGRLDNSHGRRPFAHLGVHARDGLEAGGDGIQVRRRFRELILHKLMNKLDVCGRG
jgi:hypothetical protein